MANCYFASHRYRDLFVVDATEMAIRSLEVLEDFNASGYYNRVITSGIRMASGLARIATHS